MTSGDDEIHILNEGWRLLGSDVQAELVARGWAVANLDIGDDEPLEFFWPPTAPIGYGRESDELPASPGRPPEMTAPPETPWILPTRIARIDSGWRVEYGEAIAQPSDDPVEYGDDKALLQDLPRIEWWPMSVEEARRARASARAAHDVRGRVRRPQPGLPHPDRALRGPTARDLRTASRQDPDDDGGPRRMALVRRPARQVAHHRRPDVGLSRRTARAGGDGWSISGRKNISDED